MQDYATLPTAGPIGRQPANHPRSVSPTAGLPRRQGGRGECDGSHSTEVIPALLGDSEAPGHAILRLHHLSIDLRNTLQVIARRPREVSMRHVHCSLIDMAETIDRFRADVLPKLNNDFPPTVFGFLDVRA